MTRSVMGLIAVLWLNMAVLPCAMALEGGSDCLHNPPAGDHEMAGHHGHGVDRHGVDGHGANHQTPPCATAQSQCCDVEEANVDARGGKLNLKPTSELVFISAPLIAPPSAHIPGHIDCASDPPDISGSSPPLHVLYCVYLD